MNFFFDYIYYRLTRFYFKWDGKGSSTALIGVSMIQTLVIIDFAIFISKFFYDRSETAQYTKLFSGISIALFILFFLFNYLKYKNKYNIYRNHWKNEDIHEYRKRGIFVRLALSIPWLVLILIGTLW